jgi:hypothetical protein
MNAITQKNNAHNRKTTVFFGIAPVGVAPNVTAALKSGLRSSGSTARELTMPSSGVGSFYS